MDKENILQSEKSIVNFENIPVRRVWDTEKSSGFCYCRCCSRFVGKS